MEINISTLLRVLLLVATAALFAGCATPDYSDQDPGRDASGHAGHESHSGGGGSCH